MPGWLAVTLGVVGGFAILGGALYLAVWPEPKREHTDENEHTHEPGV